MKKATRKAIATKPAPVKATAKKSTPLKKTRRLVTAPAAPAPPEATASDAAVSDAAVLNRLHAVIVARRMADPAHSHSARLLARGPAKVAQKFGEEAVECLIEAVAGNAAALVAESADVLYHLLVMWVATGVNPDQVWAELHRREGVSGIAEKAARSKPTLGTRKIP